MELVQARPTLRVNTQEFLMKVYGWMTGGLMLTGTVAYMTVSDMEFFLSVYQIMWPLIIAELVLVLALVAFINRMSATVATVMFLAYSALNGLTLSVVFLAFSGESLARVFFITAGTFGGMSFYGMTTRQDLSSVGSFCVMGLIGVLIASVVNLFLGSSQLGWITAFIGVIVFVGLTAWDTQKLSKIAQTVDHASEAGKKASIVGALTLYLDFINLFLFLLRLFGGGRD